LKKKREKVLRKQAPQARKPIPKKVLAHDPNRLVITNEPIVPHAIQISSANFKAILFGLIALSALWRCSEKFTEFMELFKQISP